MVPQNLTQNGFYHNKLGRFNHSSMVDVPFGSRIRSHDGTRHLYLLRPSSELWTRSLPHRTQILYLPDIALIQEMLELKPGSRVIESGTGSGSMTHALSRTVGPDGFVYTFDFHEERAAIAQREFTQHGLTNVLVTHRNVCRDGFELSSVSLSDTIDAVFLDLPAPWEALPHCLPLLRTDVITRICCFSPCAEQVQKTCEALRSLNFHDIIMYECLTRQWSVYRADHAPEMETIPSKRRETVKPVSDLLVSRPSSEMRGHTSYLTFASRLPQ